jgi:uncharacterized protein (DUF305 family)
LRGNRVHCTGWSRLAEGPGALLGLLLSAPVLAVLLIPAAYAQKENPPAAPSVVVQPGAPGEPSRTLPPSTRPTVPHLSQADVAFMQGMIMHHSQAVEMTAMIPSRTENKDVGSLGAKISSSQADEINFMKRWLVTRREPTSMTMPGMPEMDMSGQGAEFDRLFLTGMIQHHNGALVMVKELFDTPGAGQDADLFNFATDADNTQRAEIRIMQGMLEQNSLVERR